MKKPIVHFHSLGQTGNIFSILGLVRNELSKTEYQELESMVFESTSYANALKVIREKIDLIDLDGRF